MAKDTICTNEIIQSLNEIIRYELGCIVYYTHHAIIAHAYHYSSISTWLKKAAEESREHAMEAGDIIMSFGHKPHIDLIEIPDQKENDLHEILYNCLEWARKGEPLYKNLLTKVTDQSKHLEEYAQRLLSTDEHKAIQEFIRRYKHQEKYRQLFQPNKKDNLKVTI